MAVLFLDLNDLKVVNDTNGHEAGDLFLKAVGQRLASSIRKYETAARLGGDEFVVVLEDIHNEEDAVQIRHRITAELQQPVWISQASLYPSACIGMALYPQDGQPPAELLRFADRAMYVAKTAFKPNSQATFNAAWLQEGIANTIKVRPSVAEDSPGQRDSSKMAEVDPGTVGKHLLPAPDGRCR